MTKITAAETDDTEVTDRPDPAEAGRRLSQALTRIRAAALRLESASYGDETDSGGVAEALAEGAQEDYTGRLEARLNASRNAETVDAVG